MGGVISGAVAGLTAVLHEGGGRIATQAPLELRGPFERGAGPGLYFLRNTTAGVFAGDRYSIDIGLQDGARVQVASSSASKVHAMPGGRARIETQIHACSSSTLVWGPHTTILQADADLSQQTTIRLDAGSTVIVGEVLVLGRLARGECSAFRRFENHLTVLQQDSPRPLYEERYVLTPGDDLRAAMGGHGALASLYVLGRGLNPEWLGRVEAACDDSDAFAGISNLPNDAGLTLRALCRSLSEGETLLVNAISSVV